MSLALLALVEYLWRADGAHATYIDSLARWSRERDRVERSDHPRKTAIIGASRILFGVSLDTFNRRLPGVPVAQLAVPAEGPLSTLNSLAFDTKFDGVVLMSFDPDAILPPRQNEQAEYVDFYTSMWSLDKRGNLAIGSLLQPTLVSRHSSYGINRVVRTYLREKALPESPIYLSVRDNRQHDADFSVTDPEKMKKQRINNLVSRHDYLVDAIDQLWPQMVQRLKGPINTIHKSGGCVVFVRMPINGRWLEQDQRVFSDTKFWDSLLKQLNVYGVHYNDIDGVDSMPLPDAQHIDTRNQDRFTDSLIDVLNELGIYDANGSCRPLI